MDEMGEGDQEVQTSSYEIIKLWRGNVYHDYYSQYYCIANLKVAKKVNIKNSDHRKIFL